MNKPANFLWVVTGCHLLILVGAGHGVVPLGALLPFALRDLFNGTSALRFTGGYETRLPASLLIGLVGYILVLASAFLRKRGKPHARFAGLLFMILSLLLMLVNFATGEADGFVLFLSFPFVCALLVLVLLVVRRRRQNTESIS